LRQILYCSRNTNFITRHNWLHSSSSSKSWEWCLGMSTEYQQN
jgi:hypothetical protein